MIDYIVKDITEVAGYLPLGILCGFAAVVVYVICSKYIGSMHSPDTLTYPVESGNMENEPAGERLRAVNVWRAVVWFLLTTYMAVLVITVFLSREPGSRQGIDMTLFGTWGVTPQAHAFVIENVLLFVPFGILYPCAVHGIWRKLTVPCGCIISVMIELVQLLTERGYCQLDDVVMNTAGCVAGYIIWKLSEKCLRKRKGN